MNSFKTIKAPSEGIYKEKGSKFIAFAIPINSEIQFKEGLSRIKKNYHDAGHHCYAFSIGPKGKLFRYSDDGEPNNSAGKPIYGQLLSFGVTNVSVIVIRYFGGTKLGVGGLITAYKEAAKDALNNAKIIKKEITEVLTIDFKYESMNSIMGIVKAFDLEIAEQKFELDCIIKLNCPKRNKLQLEDKLKLIQNINFKFS
ncbi:MAG: YigZ family protein [Flavobacteriales bacterium]|nr:YigZ family protein [Flavobacteriales bacterium]